MPVFQVRRRIDAYVDYVADVEAASPVEAAEAAKDAEGDLFWREEGTCEFDDRVFIALDEEGSEIDGTQV